MDVASTRYGPDEVSLIVEESGTGRVAQFSITGWNVDLGDTSVSNVRLHQGKEVVRFVQTIDAERVLTRADRRAQ